MKLRLLCLLLIGAFTTTTAKSLLPSTSAPLYAHLYEINEQWLTEVPPVEYLQVVAFADEKERIGTHLRLVEQLLRERSVDHLTNDQQQRRLQVLDDLKHYWQRSLFPVNTYSSGRMPVFVDVENTACAVGYLLRETGEAPLVERIRQESNFADLQDLLNYRAVPEWAEAHGFTAAELTWIQPTYAVVYFDAYPFGNDLGIDGGDVLDLQVYKDELYFAGSFTAIDGHTADKLTAWDGTSFRNFPGLESSSLGRIEKIAFDEATDDLYVIGTLFGIPGGIAPTVFARYRSGVWEPLLTMDDTDLFGTFTDIICRDGKCYLTGDFSHIAGDSSLAYLALYNMSTDVWEPFSSDLRFDGILRDMSIVGDSLLVGGHSLVMVGEDTLAANIALLNITEHVLLDGGAIDVFSNEIVDYHIVDIDDDFGLYFALIGQLEDGQYAVLFTPNLGVSYGDELYVDEVLLAGYYDPGNYFYGEFNFSGNTDPFVNILKVPGESVSQYKSIVRGNGKVTALTYFNGDVIIAGDFTMLRDDTVNNLTRASILITDTDELTPVSPLSVTTDGKMLFLKNTPTVISTDATLELFDMTGRCVWRTNLQAIDAAGRVDPGSLPSGTYAYRLLIEEEMAVGQVVLFSN